MALVAMVIGLYMLVVFSPEVYVSYKSFAKLADIQCSVAPGTANDACS